MCAMRKGRVGKVRERGGDRKGKEDDKDAAFDVE